MFTDILRDNELVLSLEPSDINAIVKLLEYERLPAYLDLLVRTRVRRKQQRAPTLNCDGVYESPSE